MPLIAVTGASQGIGQAIAEQFASLPDARLALISRNVSRLQQVASRCREAGAAAAVYRCDATDQGQVSATAGAIVEQWGPPDVLINNAGAFEPGLFADMTPEVFRSQIDANLTSAFIVTQAFLQAMIDRGTGHVFFMGSVASVKAYPGGVGYCAAKHGLLGLARVVREETKETGLRVSILLPGATHTPSWQGSGLPEERFIPPEDIARVVMDLYRLTPRTVVEEILIRPQLGDI